MLCRGGWSGRLCRRLRGAVGGWGLRCRSILKIVSLEIVQQGWLDLPDASSSGSSSWGIESSVVSWSSSSSDSLSDSLTELSPTLASATPGGGEPSCDFASSFSLSDRSSMTLLDLASLWSFRSCRGEAYSICSSSCKLLIVDVMSSNIWSDVWVETAADVDVGVDPKMAPEPDATFGRRVPYVRLVGGIITEGRGTRILEFRSVIEP